MHVITVGSPHAMAQATQHEKKQPGMPNPHPSMPWCTWDQLLCTQVRVVMSKIDLANLSRRDEKGSKRIGVFVHGIGAAQPKVLKSGFVIVLQSL